MQRLCPEMTYCLSLINFLALKYAWSLDPFYVWGKPAKIIHLGEEL